jgi:hypothetical protein
MSLSGWMANWNIYEKIMLDEMVANATLTNTSGNRLIFYEIDRTAVAGNKF